MYNILICVYLNNYDFNKQLELLLRPIIVSINNKKCRSNLSYHMFY